MGTAAVVETNPAGCAIQAILGCTFGKGNLVFKDYGKNVYTIASRKKDGHSVLLRIWGNRGPEQGDIAKLVRKASLTRLKRGKEDLPQLIRTAD